MLSSKSTTQLYSVATVPSQGGMRQCLRFLLTLSLFKKKKKFLIKSIREYKHAMKIKQCSKISKYQQYHSKCRANPVKQNLEKYRDAEITNKYEMSLIINLLQAQHLK